MWPVVPLTSSLVLSSAAVAANVAVLSLGMWERRRRIVLGGAAVLGGVVLAHAAWWFGPVFAAKYWGATIASLLLCFAIPMIPAALVAMAGRALAKRWVRRKETELTPPPPAAISRRAFVSVVTAAAPVVAGAATTAGFASANAAPNVPLVRLPYADLAPELRGFRILQLSDLHLGVERRTRDVEALVRALHDARQIPDLVVLTGDVAEDPAELVPAMKALRELGAPMGIYASLGNHEYFGDVLRTRRDYDRAGVPLLVSAGHTLRRGGARLHLSGLDDPRAMHGDHDPFLRASLDRALDGAPSDAFHLVLSHRPEGLVPAARENLGLVLSGHTHGGQVGFANKSAFEPIWPESYLWGRYRRGSTHLYTTSGFGHWFPFRLLCPTEAPLVELVGA